MTIGPAKPTNPASSGPAGSEFEAQVGAFYLLSMLAGSEPLGLPGTVVDRIRLQGAGEGYPLDDVVVQSHDIRGTPATLEIQVKRSISFAPSDDVFKSVVSQIVEAARKPGFWESKHELAVATARTSRKIDGAYQDVLTWARHVGSAETFAARIARKGAASDDMRIFVNTFISHLREEGFPHDDETVWKLLRRFQILIFDFSATSSASEALARERSARALDSSEATRGGELWGALEGIALHFAARGGDLTQETLRNEPALKGFRWAGEPRHLRALAALAENGDAALADIRDQINGVSISRPTRVAEVRAKLEQGRYVEIRGDAGVGKSGILKHFALQAKAASGIIVLKPGRTTPRGWTALRAALNFDGSARDLLVELSASGTALLFIDNLDLFTVEEQATVNDLLRAVATVPGFSVIATARRKFGSDEGAWLAQDGLQMLGHAQPIVIGELDDTEVAEMGALVPSLAGLLSSTRPARDVTRNLFRLARLAGRPKDAPDLRTETDMADEWWDTADGPPEGRRERQRVLRYLAEQALGAVATFDVSSQPSPPVDRLIASETLRDYGSDRVGFRHDVLREWAIAKLISLNEETLERLPLGKPAPAFLARSVELYARALIEGAEDDQSWSAFLDRLTGPGVHGSWRRAAILALVRSEAAAQTLQKATPSLFATGGAVLNELIRTTMAVDVEPGREMFATSGIDVALLPEGFVVPSGPSWFRLITWLLRLDDELPGGCIPDVVDLFNAWSLALLGIDPITPRLLARLHQWLTMIEAARDARYSEYRSLFGDTLTSGQIRSLEGELRRGFVTFANRVPELAAEYLRTAKDRKEREQIATSLREFRGTLAAAAPKELADLFEAALIPTARSDKPPRYPQSFSIDGVFTHFDSSFLPVSPAQGPFYDLLNARPEAGKRLIRRLIDHAIAQTCEFKDEKDAIEITAADGVRRFPWLFTFMWSREASARYYAITSGLMALEGWAHARIEAGESVEAVIADVLGPSDAPAAYLLVAIDLILSHWPASREVAIPFIGNPHLIILDRERHSHEQIKFPDIYGLKALEREPVGQINAKSLADRPSRKLSLYEHLKYYTFADDPAQRDRLITLLKSAAEGLDALGPDSNFGDPEFMVLHALNQLDPANWRPVELKLGDGHTEQAREYVSPQSEADHLAPFQAEAQEMALETQVHGAAATILEDPSRGSPQAAKFLAEWAMAQPLPAVADTYGEDNKLSSWATATTIINIAMIAMRDGDSELRQRSREWALKIFEQRLAQSSDREVGPLSRLQFNPVAIAFAGVAFSLRDQAEEGDIRRILEIATHRSSAVSRGFAVSASAIAQIDERLLKSVLRCAFRARIYCHRDWELEENIYKARKAELRKKVDAAIDKELDWIAERGAEPDWPEFPLRNPPPGRRIRIGAGPVQPQNRRVREDEHVDSGGAADWLEGLRDTADVFQRPWLRGLIEHYRAWTCDANGGSLGAEDEVDHPPREWNDAYFNLMTACLPGLSATEVDTFALDFICSLPSSNAFFNVSARFLRSLDVMYLDTDSIDPMIAAHVRQSLAKALKEYSAWNRFAKDRSASVEHNIGDVVSAFFFHIYGGFSPPRCYLYPDSASKVHPLLPVLQTLAVEAPSLLIASETMSMLEVAPHLEQLTFAIAAMKAWATQRQDDPVFWVDYSIGRRFCQWLERLQVMQPTRFISDSPERNDIDQSLAVLVRAGVPEAGRLEASLSNL